MSFSTSTIIVKKFFLYFVIQAQVLVILQINTIIKEYILKIKWQILPFVRTWNPLIPTINASANTMLQSIVDSCIQTQPMQIICVLHSWVASIIVAYMGRGAATNSCRSDNLIVPLIINHHKLSLLSLQSWVYLSWCNVNKINICYNGCAL